LIEFRDYQKQIINKGIQTIRMYNFVYLAMEVRTGKTLTSMGIAHFLKAKNVLFLTKKKAISSIESDYELLAPDFDITVINYESMHKIPQRGWDFVILDEAHGMGAFPKPSKRAKDVKNLLAQNRARVILLSGTPTPESYSQMYHQVYGIPNNPFASFKNFYRFADRYVMVQQKKIAGYNVNDYSRASDAIVDIMSDYTIRFSQKEAGFVVDTTEHVLRSPMDPNTKEMIKLFKKDLVIEMEDGEVILGDTGAKQMSKVHQMCSGTVKFESGRAVILDTNKAEFIKQHFDGKKIGIFYKFKAELEALKTVFGDRLVTELDDFNDTDKNIALQIVSGREGISLRQADALVYYNIDFSATSYWQSRDRMTTKDRLKNDIYWIFSEGGIELQVYGTVRKKKDFTLKHYRKDLLS